MRRVSQCIAIFLGLLLLGCGTPVDPGGGAGGGVSGSGGGAAGGTGGQGGGNSSGAGGGGEATGGSGGSGGSGGGAGGGVATGRADTPLFPCNDLSASLDAASLAGLAAHSDSTRGDVLGCATETSLTQSDADAKLTGTGVSATNAVDRYRIAFRVTRGNGTGGVATARVWLPHGVAGPADVVLVAHGSEGIADGCAPTRKEGGNIEDLALPFAARGRVAVATDYAGLGTDGAQGYLDNHDTGYSLLDSGRAVRKLLGPGATTDATAAIGHSQGGGAVMAAQALAGTYGPPLKAAVGFAPQYPIRFNSFGFLNALRNPGALTISLGVSKPPMYVLRQYAYEVNMVGPAAKGDGFPQAKRASLVGAVESQCVIPLGGSVQATSPKVGDLFDDTFRLGLLACVDGTAGCTGGAQAAFNFYMQNLLINDAQGARVLILQGGLDNVMPPAEEAACITDKMRGDGVTVDTCVDPGAVHTTIIDRTRGHATRWIDAVLGGTALPTCPVTGTLPACVP